MNLKPTKEDLRELSEKLESSPDVVFSIRPQEAFLLVLIMQVAAKHHQIPCLESANIRNFGQKVTELIEEVSPELASALEASWEIDLGTEIKSDVPSEIKFTDLDFYRKEQLVFQSWVSAIAINMLADAASKSAQEIKDRVETFANQEVQMMDTTEIERLVCILESETKPVTEDTQSESSKSNFMAVFKRSVDQN